MNRRLHQKTIFFSKYSQILHGGKLALKTTTVHACLFTLFTRHHVVLFQKKKSSYIFVVKTLPPPDPPEPLALLNHRHCTEIARKIQMSIDHFHPQSRALK